MFKLKYLLISMIFSCSLLLFASEGALNPSIGGGEKEDAEKGERELAEALKKAKDDKLEAEKREREQQDIAKAERESLLDQGKRDRAVEDFEERLKAIKVFQAFDFIKNIKRKSSSDVGDFIRMLSKEGIDLNSLDIKGEKTFLNYLAVTNIQTATYALIRLLHEGADPNFIAGNMVDSPLHTAVRSTQPGRVVKIIKDLLNNKGDLYRKNKEGKTCFDLARENRSPDFLRWLKREHWMRNHFRP